MQTESAARRLGRTAKIGLFLLAAALGVANAAAPSQASFTDPRLLDPQAREQYERIVRTLDRWNGDADWLSDVETLIDGVARKDSRFVPVEVERARLTIMKSNFDSQNANRLVGSALEILVSVNKRAPLYPKAYVLAGHANVVLGRFDAAKVALDRAAALKSTDPWLQYNYSDMYGQTGRYAKAVSYAVSAILTGLDNERVVSGAIYQLDKFIPRLEGERALADVGKSLFNGLKDESSRMRLAALLVKGSGRSPIILGCAESMLQLQQQRTPDLPDIAVIRAQMALESGIRFLRDGIPRFAPTNLATARQLLASVLPSPRTRDAIFDMNTTIAFSLEDLSGASRLIESAADVSKNLVDEKRATWLFLSGDYVASVDLMQELVLRDRKYSNHPVLLMGQTTLGKSDKYIAAAKSKMELYKYDAKSMGSYAGILLYTADDPDGAIDYGERALKKEAYGVLKATLSLAHLIKAVRLYEAGDAVRAKIHKARAEEIGYDEEYLLERCRRHCTELRLALRPRFFDEPPPFTRTTPPVPPQESTTTAQPVIPQEDARKLADKTFEKDWKSKIPQYQVFDSLNTLDNEHWNFAYIGTGEYSKPGYHVNIAVNKTTGKVTVYPGR